MRRFSILFLALVWSFSASAVSVTLNCDMGTIPVSADGMHLAGDLQIAANLGAANWTPNSGTLNQLTDPDGDHVYSITFDIPAGTYNYKFVNGFDGWEDVPSACATGGNRGLVVEAYCSFSNFLLCSLRKRLPYAYPGYD